jgi:hypothetical protein
MRFSRRIFVCQGPAETKWQVRAPAQGELLLLGWFDADDTVDDGVPDWARGLLARVFTHGYWVTFPATESPARAGVAIVRRVERIFHRSFKVVTTRDPRIAQHAFDDAGFPWWLQAQVILLTPADHAAIELDADTVVKLATSDSVLWPPGIVAQVRAGVDGDLAAVYCTERSIADELVARLAEHARDASVQFDLLTEPQFSDALAGV